MLLRGMLVGLPNKKGIAKLESVTEGRCKVLIFYSIRRSEIVEFGLNEVARAYLSPQTRVYISIQDRMRVGRVTGYFCNDNGSVTYEIRFPNGKQGDYGEADLFVRPWNAPEDPAEILAAGGAESQFLHDRRQSAVIPLLALRSAAQGLTSVISAGIDLVPHQLAAVRRVLSDPIQRYLLADEVGLGKTIEAGLIIRQHLIDNPDTSVLIATPPQLCEQWRSEMIEKLRLDQFGEAFECCSHEELARIAQAPDVLVVDEAHHLVLSAGQLAPSAERLRSLAHDAPVLLLLSATPPLGEEAKFLALLNLLDPLTHPIGDLKGFREKLERRREVGRLLLSLDPEVPGIVLRQRGAELQRTFLNDPVVQELAPRLIEATREAPQDIPGLCAALREHIADSYRIHQRLIRSRRVDAKGWEFRSRGPTTDGEPNLSHVRSESDPAEKMGDLLRALEDWRFAAAEATAGDPLIVTRMAARYAKILSSISTGAEEFRVWLAGANASFRGEEEILEGFRSIVDGYDDIDRIATMIESTRRLLKTLKSEVSHPKLVVFATSTETAVNFHNACGGIEAAGRYLLIGNRCENADAILRDFRIKATTGILVTDCSGEEGLNLSFAHAIIHLDLPLSAARIEQRIGRLDRFGRRHGTIRHRIMLPSDEDVSPWGAWFNLLAEGFAIFNRSISDVQFLLDEFEARTFSALLLNGPDALNALVAEIRNQIDAERKSQDEQYALDRIALAEEPIEALVQSFDNAESDESVLEDGVDRWLVDALQLKKRPFKWPDEDPFKLFVTGHTLIPKLPWQSEIKFDDARPLSWKRRVATGFPEVTLLRPGTPMIDVIERFTRWDDRGTAFITSRTAPEWHGDLWIGFKLCFVAEADIELSDLLAPTRAELAEVRRAQRYLAPSAHTIYIDINGDAVTNDALLTILQKPYRAEGDGPQWYDVNLGSRPQTLAEIISIDAFEKICITVRDDARRRLINQPQLADRIDAGVKLAEADLDRYRNRLQRRQSAGDAMARNDLNLIEAILPRIQHPAIRLDAMGCFIVSQRPLRRNANDCS